MMSKLVALIQTEERKGEGVVGDPIRRVTSYWTPEGDKVFEVDEWKEQDTLRRIEDLLARIDKFERTRKGVR